MLFILLCSLNDEQQTLVEKIFKENKKTFYNIAYSYFNSESDANDVVSESMIKIIKNIEKISKLSCPQMRSFCVTIIRNTAIDMLRKNKHIVYVEKSELENIVDKDIFLTLKNERLENLLDVVAKLSDEERKLVYLHFGYGKGYKEVAQVLNISEETAKKRGQRILLKLKKLLEKEDCYD